MSRARGPHRPMQQVPDGDIANRDAAVLRCETPEQVEVEIPVRPDLEAVRSEPRDREVAADAAALVEHQRVHDRADRPVQAVGREPVEEGQRARPGDLQALERGHVVETGRLARGERLRAGDGMPVAFRPGIAARDLVATQQPLVDAVPVRPLPAVALEEERTELLLALVERRRPERSRVLHRLERMDDVVDLDVVLDTPVVDVRRRQLVGLESVDVALVEVRWRAAIHQPFGHRLADAAGVGDPDGLGQPEALDVGRLAHERGAVRGEREDPVDARFDLDARPAQGRHDPLRPRPRLREGVGREVQDGRHDRRLARRQDRGGIDRHRDVGVRPDAEPVDVLAEIEVAVLGAHDRMDVLAVGRDREGRHLGQGVRLRVLVGERLQRHRHPDHGPDERAPDPGRAHDDVRLDLALIGHDRADPAVVGADPGHGVAAEERGRRPRWRGGPALRTRGRPWRARRSGRGRRPGWRRGPRAATGGQSRPGRSPGSRCPTTRRTPAGDGARGAGPRSARARGCRPG